ncbi:hypothetical protein LTR84_005818 [Exophiala bonariae]|uniref:GA4 desaturase n=1 Tax=Exophiala bonariae TaxID=1690606 RepID=A0AAV9N4X7_9EURO|nr:hypothetical protein LTR84_005818 [Exophiala bonariae]
MSTTATTESLPVKSVGSKGSKSVEGGVVHYVRPGDVPVTSPHLVHLPHISEFRDPCRIELHDLRPIRSIEEYPRNEVKLGELAVRGFLGVHCPSALNAAPYFGAHWRDQKLIDRVYVPEAVDMIKKVTGAKQAFVEMVVLRAAAREEVTNPEPYGAPEGDLPYYDGFQPNCKGVSPEPRVHVDLAPAGARNHIRHVHPKMSDAVAPIIAAEDRLKALGLSVQENYHAPGSKNPRWAVYSLWRPVKRVPRDPLAVADSTTLIPTDYVPANVNMGTYDQHCYTATFSPRHKWYWLPEQEPDEVLIITLFDSLMDKQQPIPGGGALHTSVDLEGTENVTEKRQSTELRVLVIWD